MTEAASIPELSSQDLAFVGGGVKLVVENGQEQYPADIGSLSKKAIRRKGRRRK